jgi:putative phosphoesterase
MKLLLASDLHGSGYYAEKLIEIIGKEKPDKTILLGDIYYHGPRNPFPEGYAPMKVAELLNGIKDSLIVIKGNCDSEVDQTISEFTFIEGYFVYVLADKKLVCVHGHKMEINDLPELSSGDIVAYGHYHTGIIENKESVIYVNPGSIALPKDNHSYAIITDNAIEIKNVAGEVLKRLLLN